jgi:hypothetical protein
MKSKAFFKHDGHVIRTHRPLADWVVALLTVTGIVLVLGFVDWLDAGSDDRVRISEQQRLAAWEAGRAQGQRELQAQLNAAWQHEAVLGCPAGVQP